MKPRLGQGRAGLRHKIKKQISKPLTQGMEKPPSDVLQPNTYTTFHNSTGKTKS